MKKPHVRRLISTAPLLILLTLSMALAISSAIIVTNLNKGFDFGDESWSYSLISNDTNLVGEAWGFQHLLHPLFAFIGEHVLTFRGIRLALYVIEAFVSAFLVITLMRLRGNPLFGLRKATVFVASGLGATLAWSYPPKYLSYNELASLFLIILLSCWVQLLSYSNQSPMQKSRRRVKLYSALIGVGILIPMLFVSRFPSGLLALTVSGLVFVCLHKSVQLAMAPIISLTIAIAIATFMLLGVLGFPLEIYFGQWWNQLTSKGQSDAGHPISYLISTYAHSLVSAIIGTLPIIASGFLLFLRLPVARSLIAYRWLPVSLATAIILLNLSVSPPNHMQTWMNIGTFIAVALILIAFLEFDIFLKSRSERPVNFKFRVFSTALVLSVPLCASVGTNNALLGQFLFTAAPLFALLVSLLWTRLEKPHHLSTVVAQTLIILSISIWSVASVWAEHSIHPYGTLPASQQMYTTKSEFLRGIYVDAGTRSEVDGLSSLAERLDLKDDSLVISLQSPGAHLFFGNTKSIGPWINSVSPASIEAIGAECLARGEDHIFVISRLPSPSQDAVVGLVNQQLSECSLKFPESFIRITSIKHDGEGLLSIWRSQGK